MAAQGEMPMRRTVLCLVLALAPGAAIADRQAGDACSKALSPAARTVYDGTIAKRPAPGEARAVVVAEVEGLMKTQGLSMMAARQAGQAAGQCLELIQK
jgi:hypothetical protein